MDSLDISFFIALAREENGVRKGYQQTEGLWFPHESVEGGNPTIAYGHKLLKSEVEGRVYGFGIDNFAAVDLLVQDFNTAWNKVEKDWDRFFVEKFYTLPKAYQYILAELCFNVGSLASSNQWKWPKLAQSIRNNDDQGVYENAQRYFHNQNNEKKRLTRRVIEIHRSLGLDFKPLKD